MTFPIYVPSCGRAYTLTTPWVLADAGLPCTIVVEPHEAAHYATDYPGVEVLALPLSGQGVHYARNYIKSTSIWRGEAWHWQLDDNLTRFGLRTGGAHGKTRKLPADRVRRDIFDFIERHVLAREPRCGLASPVHMGFAHWRADSIFSRDGMAYCAALIRNEVDAWWRPDVPDDVDFAVQTLVLGWQTLRFNHRLFDKDDSQPGGLTPVYRDAERQRARVENFCEAWDPWFTFKQTPDSRVSWRLNASRIWTFLRAQKERSA